MSSEPAIPPRIRRPLLLVISAPSGAGKSTLCRGLREAYPALRASVSCTTRLPRGQETDGRDYRFLSAAEFERRVRAGAFLEWAEVHAHRYGTLRATVAEALQAGQDIVLAIDVQGAAQIRRAVRAAPSGDLLRRGFVDIFVAPPSMEVLRRRLEARGEDDPAAIARRLANAADELGQWRNYRYLVVNDRLDEAVAEMRGIVAAEHCRVEEDGAGS